MAASGSYIENGVSPDLSGIMQYLDVWMHDLEKEEGAAAYVQTSV
jgi:hypothetical protein